MKSGMRFPRTPIGSCPGFWLVLAIVGLLFSFDAGAQSYVNFEGKLTRPICLSPDGTRLFAVNTPDARLSVFDVTHPLKPFLIAEIPVGIEPVSVNARSHDEVWVVNEVSDSVSIVSVSSRLVVDTLYVKDEPTDVVFANGKAFVSASRNNRIAVFDGASHVLLTNIVVAGESPRALAVNTNGTKVYAAFALSGNRTTILSLSNAPAQSPPTNPNLPPAPKVGRIVDATDPLWSPSVINFTMPDNDVVEIDTGTLTTNRYFKRVGTINLALAVQPGSGDLFVANTDARNLVHLEPHLNGFFATNRLTRVSIADGTSLHYDLNAGYHPTNFTLANKTNALAQPAALVFEPDGVNLYLAAFGSDRVVRMNAASGSVLARIELCPTAPGSAADSRNMRGPRGLALKPGVALYVLNRVSGTISIIDPLSNLLVGEVAIGSFDPTPVTIRNGRGFLYDAKRSGNGTVSCATCHIDSEMDMLGWDLGDPAGEMGTNRIAFDSGVLRTNTSVSKFHPMKGPMTTQTLRGLNGLDPFHWRGDRTNFTHFNLAFATLLGGTTLSEVDMNAYRDFINTIRFQPNPNQNLDRTYPTNLPGVTGNPRAGFTNFTTATFIPFTRCTTCHEMPNGSARFVATAATFFPNLTSQDFKVPHLRNVYQRLNFNPTPGAESISGFGLSHDGAFGSGFDFLSKPFFGPVAADTNRKNNLSAFLMCFDTGMAPAVGYTRTLAATNVIYPDVVADWALLEAQALGANIDLVVAGTIDGRHRGLLFQPGLGNYKADSTNLAAFTHAQLVTKIQAGDKLSIMGVPPGAGQRMGIDRNLNGVLDADEPLPGLQIASAGSTTVLQWSASAAGFILEESTGLSPTIWNAATNEVTTTGGFNYATNAPGPGAKFFRLRMP